MFHRDQHHYHWKYVIYLLLISLSVSEQLDIRNRKKLMEMKEKCKQEKQTLDNELQKELRNLKRSDRVKAAELKKKYASMVSDDCKAVQNFKVTQLNENEVKAWLNASKKDVNEVYEVLKGANKETLKELLKKEKDGWLKKADQKPLLTALGEEIVKKSGGSKGLTVKELQEFGSAAVNMIRPVDYRGLSDEVFKYILGLVSNETQKALQSQQNSEVNVDIGAVSTMILRDPNKAKIKALCQRTFNMYKKSKDLNTNEGWNNIKYLLFCAPPNVCKAIDNNKIQSDVELIANLPWSCRTVLKEDGLNTVEENMMQLEKITRRLFPSNRPCGKILAEKLVIGGKMPYQINKQDDLARLQYWSACLPDKVLKEKVDSLGCDFAAESTKRGILNQRLSNYAAKKCASAPDDMENVTCASLETVYRPYLQSMKRSFFKNLPQHIMCNASCVELFKEKLPGDIMKHIMRKCYKEKTLTSDELKELGGLVTELPLNKFEEISAEDLEKNIKEIKKDLKASPKGRGEKVVLRKLAKKLIDDGNLAGLVDSPEIMKEVSLKDLKKSLAESDDVIKDLGINSVNGSLGMTDSQKKWVMKEVMKKKQPENFQVEDLREMKSLVTGLLSSHIKKMGEAHSEDGGGMVLATEMCSYSDWPRKSLEAVNKYLIQGSLEVRNSTEPMSTLTAVDVQGLGCHCLLNFDALKYEVMDRDVCSAMCMKIGYCDTFRCLNPTRRKNLLQACLKCKGLGKEVITETDFDELGPNLISQMSKTQLDLIPAPVLNSGIEFFKEMCMDQTLRTAVSDALQEVIGRSGADFTSDTLYLLSSAIKLLPRSLQEQLDKNVVAEMQTSLIEELAPNTDEGLRLKKCCEKWLDEADLENLKEQNFNLMLTIKAAMFSQVDTTRRRRKRANKIFVWTCRLIRPYPILFASATSEEIDAMDEKDLLDCLPVIGSITELKDWQKSKLLTKAKKVLPKANVCEMEISDIADLGFIAHAFTNEEIRCLPLEDNRLVAFLGSLKGWSAGQLRVLAKSYVSANSISTLAKMSSSDITMLGTILCGFTVQWIETISSYEIGKVGENVGKLKECDIKLLTALAKLAAQKYSYGPVKSWGAAEVKELQYIVAGLPGDDIKKLSVNAIEGLEDSVIQVFPANVFKEMSINQLKTFTDKQIHAVTNAQKRVMTREQRALLNDEHDEPQGQAEGQSSSGSALEKTLGSLLTVVMTFLFLVSKF